MRDLRVSDETGAGGRAVRVEPGAVWLLVGLALAAVLVWILVTHALDTLILLFIAITFGEGIRPLVNWLEAHRLPRPLAVLGIYILIAVVLLGLLGLLLAPLTVQLIDLVSNLPTYLQRAQAELSQLQQLTSNNPQAQQLIQSLPAQLGSLGTSLAGTLLSAPLLAVSAGFKFIELYLMAFFWLTATQALKGLVLSIFPLRSRGYASDVIAELGSKLGGHVRAVAINACVIALLSGGGLFALHVPYPLLLALVAGLAETLPLLGPWMAGAFAVIITLFTGGFIQAGEVVGLYLLIHLIEGNTLVPYVTYRLTRLNPLATIVAISAGGAMLGLVGAVLAVPAALVVDVALLRVAIPGLRRLAGVAPVEPTP